MIYFNDPTNRTPYFIVAGPYDFDAGSYDFDAGPHDFDPQVKTTSTEDVYSFISYFLLIH